MRVICIDDSGCDLKEGHDYNVTQSPYASDMYTVYGFEIFDGWFAGYYKHRFIPLSNIDELELVNKKEEVV
jgi:hypothetical protein